MACSLNLESQPRISEEETLDCYSVESNRTFGRYIVATRLITQGELIIQETALSVGPYGPDDPIPICLSCYIDLSLSPSSVCSKCNWPVCNSICEKHSAHAKNECPILSLNKVRPENISNNDYLCIEVLRCLLYRENDCRKWNQIMNLESHIDARKNSEEASKVFSYVKNFIQTQCGLMQFDTEAIDQVVGVLSINTYWAFKNTNRYVSALYHIISFVSHDCNCNTTREMIEVGAETGSPQEIALCLFAERNIEPGEMITTHYVNPCLPVKERQAQLKKVFYFSCGCDRCLAEMMECF